MSISAFYQPFVHSVHLFVHAELPYLFWHSNGKLCAWEIFSLEFQNWFYQRADLVDGGSYASWGIISKSHLTFCINSPVCTQLKYVCQKIIFAIYLTLLTMDELEKHTPLALHIAFSPQLSDLTVTFNRTHCGPHKSDTTAMVNTKISYFKRRILWNYATLKTAFRIEIIARIFYGRTDQKVYTFGEILIEERDQFSAINNQWSDVKQNTFSCITVFMTRTSYLIHGRHCFVTSGGWKEQN